MAQIEDILNQYKSFVLAEAYLKALHHQIAEGHHQLDQIFAAKRDSEMRLNSYENMVAQSNSESFEQEKERYYRLVTRYKELHKRIDLAKFEVSVLEDKMKNSADIHAQLHEFLKQDLPDASQSGILHLDLILGFTQKIEEKKGLKKEVSEAISKGEILLKEIKLVKKFLKEIKKQMTANGVFDSLIGVSLVKLEKFQKMARVCMSHLEGYEKEIADIYEYLHIPNAAKFRDGNEFIDQYFEKLSTDRLFSLSEKDCSFYLQRISEKVTHTQQALNNKFAEVKEHIESLEEKRGLVIVESMKK